MMKLQSLLLLLLLTGCSGTWYLKQAIKKGIVIKSDTEGSKTHSIDTVYNFIERVKIDTFKSETVKWSSKIHYDTITKTVFQEVDCKPDTVKVPVSINNDFDKAIEKEFPYNLMFLSIIAVCALIIALKIAK